jgi:hypothetical protein
VDLLDRVAEALAVPMAELFGGPRGGCASGEIAAGRAETRLTVCRRERHNNGREEMRAETDEAVANKLVLLCKLRPMAPDTSNIAVVDSFVLTRIWSTAD